MTHTEILNYLIDRYGFQSYLEIGVQKTINNFDWINCKDKHGVDPDVSGPNQAATTSDHYFSYSLKMHDLIFIDGLHEYTQVRKDLINALNALKKGGMIVLHDTMPENEQGTNVPRETKRWWGDVYKLAMELESWKGINFVTAPLDEGCTIIWRKGKLLIPEPDPCNWSDYNETGHIDIRVRENWMEYLPGKTT